MNNPGASSAEVVAKSSKHLLDTIRNVRAEVGDGLSDEEFTLLLQQAELPGESGFSFLCYCDRFVTLKVPPQELGNWYSEKGRIVPSKEKIARALADKYGLSLCEPPDMLNSWFYPPNPHHHLQLSNHLETVIIIHPQYLKIRLFVAASATRSAQIAQKPLPVGPDLLQNLSTLYRE